jgi:hypothetical protein
VESELAIRVKFENGAVSTEKNFAPAAWLARQMCGLPNVQSLELPVGKLAVHEDFPTLIAEAVQSFVNEEVRSAPR